MLKVVEKKKIWFSISAIVILIGIGFMVFKGLNLGIDFAGGTSVVFEFGGEFDKAEVDKMVKEYAKDPVTNTINDTQYEVKSKDFPNDKVTEFVKELKEKYDTMPEEDSKVIVSQDEVGASIGKDLTKSSLIALAVAFVAMLIYIAIRFEFKFGIAALTALIHDVLITLSVYAIFRISVNSPFIAAILTIVGYSINATIVIFDRIRENRKANRRADVNEITNKSISQTMARSINTTLTTLFTIVAVFIFVPSVREFSFPIIIGILSGLYSSITIAPSVWTLLEKKNKKSAK